MVRDWVAGYRRRSSIVAENINVGVPYARGCSGEGRILAVRGEPLLLVGIVRFGSVYRFGLSLLVECGIQRPLDVCES